MCIPKENINTDKNVNVTELQKLEMTETAKPSKAVTSKTSNLKDSLILKNLKNPIVSVFFNLKLLHLQRCVINSIINTVPRRPDQNITADIYSIILDKIFNFTV